LDDLPYVQMTAFSQLILVLGLIVYLYGQIRFLVAAHNRSDFWFFGCLFVPLVDCLFLLLNFRATVKPFALSLLGLILVMFSG
jgi:hypothetical protein